MPSTIVNGAKVHYAVHGAGPRTLVFIHGLMLASESFEAQVAAFQDRYRIVTFDLRGQGRSEKTRDRLDLDSLAEDAAVVVETIAGGPAHVVGFSMGTFIAMRLAARRPDLVQSLTLIGPSADAEEPENMPKYRRLIRFVRLFGPRPVAGRLMMILFGDTYLNAPETAPGRLRWKRVVEGLPRVLHRAAAASAHRAAVTGELAAIVAPTLVVSGQEDRPISPARARAVCAGIAGARFASFARTGHAVMIERPAAFNAALQAFLDEVAPG
ncbi:MAG: alpha/beta hydrolase [Hyphomonadaceae bacterium]|nr:alpha/beta hydrolase [Hyphomonadaceae bacterium]